MFASSVSFVLLFVSCFCKRPIVAEVSTKFNEVLFSGTPTEFSLTVTNEDSRPLRLVSLIPAYIDRPKVKLHKISIPAVVDAISQKKIPFKLSSELECSSVELALTLEYLENDGDKEAATCQIFRKKLRVVASGTSYFDLPSLGIYAMLLGAFFFGYRFLFPVASPKASRKQKKPEAPAAKKGAAAQATDSQLVLDWIPEKHQSLSSNRKAIQAASSASGVSEAAVSSEEDAKAKQHAK